MKPEVRLTHDQAVILEALPRPARRLMLALMQSKNAIKVAQYRKQVIAIEQKNRKT